MTGSSLDVVVDASALVAAIDPRSTLAPVVRAQLRGGVHAPHLIDAEVGNVLRRLELSGVLSPTVAGQALRAARQLVSFRHPVTDALSAQVWRLRHNLTFYDGIYVALATALGLTLLTCDARLAAAPGLTCPVLLV